MEIDYDTLYSMINDFCKSFEPWYKKQFLSDGKIQRNRACQLNLSEILTILIAYHQSGMSCFKYYYLNLLSHHKDLFPDLVHYDRFISLMQRAFPALICLLKSLEGEVTEYLFIDSTPMAVCHNLREKRHKVFKALASKARTSTGWFFEMKLHMIFNTLGEIVRLTITRANVNDRTPVSNMVKGLSAKLIGDKRYLSKKLFQELFEKGITLITKIKKNMKNILMETADKLMLMRRFFVETIFSSMKSLNTLIHHRHRCPINAFCHLLAGLINYQLRPDKPTLHSFLKFSSYP